MMITQLILLKDSSPLVHIKNTNQTTRTEGVKVQFLTLFKKRDHDSWGFVPRSKKIDKLCKVSSGSTQVGSRIQNFVDKRKQVASDSWVLKIVEEGLRLKFVSKPPKSGVRTTNLLNIVHMSNILEEVKNIIRKRCYRISTTRSGRQGFLQPKAT
jgi:hypothetical protein